jgi:hypothetical protein
MAYERGVRFIVDTIAMPLPLSARPAIELQNISGSGTCSITSDATTTSKSAPAKYPYEFYLPEFLTHFPKIHLGIPIAFSKVWSGVMATLGLQLLRGALPIL